MTNDETEPDYKVAERELRAIVTKHSLTMHVNRLPDSSYEERGTLKFAGTISNGKESTAFTYQCGSAIPLHAARKRIEAGETVRSVLPWEYWPTGANADYVKECILMQSFGRRLSIDADRIRVAVRSRYLPEVYDIVSCLCSDAATLDSLPPGADWLDWAQEFGALEDATAESLRSLQESFVAMQRQYRFLARVLGGDFDTAKDLVQRL